MTLCGRKKGNLPEKDRRRFRQGRSEWYLAQERRVDTRHRVATRNPIFDS